MPTMDVYMLDLAKGGIADLIEHQRAALAEA